MAFRIVLSSLVRSALKPSPTPRRFLKTTPPRFRKTGSPIKEEHGTEKLGGVESWDQMMAQINASRARLEKTADDLAMMVGSVIGLSIGGLTVFVHRMLFADKK